VFYRTPSQNILRFCQVYLKCPLFVICFPCSSRVYFFPMSKLCVPSIFSWFLRYFSLLFIFFCYFQFCALFRCSSFILLVFFSYSSGALPVFFNAFKVFVRYPVFFSCSLVFVQVLFRFPSCIFQVFLSLPSVVLLLFLFSYSSDASCFFCCCSLCVL